MATDKTFACVINCMDGRVQDAVKNYMKENYSIDYVDMVTEAGPNKILADNLDLTVIENIKKRVEVSVHHHGSKVVAIVGHFGCAGNPTEKEIQVEHLKKAEETVKAFGLTAQAGSPIEVVSLWVDGDWQTVEKVQAYKVG